MNPKTKKILLVVLITIVVYLFIGYLFAAYAMWSLAYSEDDSLSTTIQLVLLGPFTVVPQFIFAWQL